MPEGERSKVAVSVFLTAALILALDRVTKIAVYNSLTQGQSLGVIDNIFHLTLVLNKGAAFGIFKYQRTFFVTLSTIAIFVIIRYILKNREKSRTILFSLGLILGGAAGNLIDRLKFGYVIDFLDFRIWPVFNIADSAITIGAVILCIRILARKGGGEDCIRL